MRGKVARLLGYQDMWHAQINLLPFQKPITNRILTITATATALAFVHSADPGAATRRIIIIPANRGLMHQILHPVRSFEITELFRGQEGMKEVLEVHRVCLAVYDLAKIHTVNFIADDSILFFEDALLDLQDLAQQGWHALLELELVKELLGLFEVGVDTILHFWRIFFSIFKIQILNLVIGRIFRIYLIFI